MNQEMICSAGTLGVGAEESLWSEVVFRATGQDPADRHRSQATPIPKAYAGHYLDFLFLSAIPEHLQLLPLGLGVCQPHSPLSSYHCSPSRCQNGAVPQDQGIGEPWHRECLRKNRKQLYTLSGWAWHELLCVDRVWAAYLTTDALVSLSHLQEWLKSSMLAPLRSGGWTTWPESMDDITRMRSFGRYIFLPIFSSISRCPIRLSREKGEKCHAKQTFFTHS